MTIDNRITIKIHNSDNKQQQEPKTVTTVTEVTTMTAVTINACDKKERQQAPNKRQKL
jgi:hypothetical protein